MMLTAPPTDSTLSISKYSITSFTATTDAIDSSITEIDTTVTSTNNTTSVDQTSTTLPSINPPSINLTPTPTTQKPAASIKKSRGRPPKNPKTETTNVSKVETTTATITSTTTTSTIATDTDIVMDDGSNASAKQTFKKDTPPKKLDDKPWLLYESDNLWTSFGAFMEHIYFGFHRKMIREDYYSPLPK
eukprot:TRINITY_DN6307_c0_g1_i2.p1 TRINITY_DN6307_c0_g1~~TRINITY_DN6307_c0_g1_i2.p1  ORF type:complete len:189 (-),score=49.62 TRINITY_DN6307_c0_g1_i2:331-897(-)